MSMDDKTLLYEVAKLAQFEACDAIWWRCDDGKLHVFARCSDVFDWGTADCEEITPENLDVLRQAVADVAEVAGEPYSNQRDGFLLFVARARKERPQGAMYRYLTVQVFEPGPPNEHGFPTHHVNEERSAEQTAALRALFDAAGPERAIDICNPKDQDGVYRYETAGGGA